MFEITVTKRFRAVHFLKNYRGSDEEPHEHEWACEATISSETLDEAGCAIDFAIVDKALECAIEPITGRSIGKTSMFSETSPSAENIAIYLHHSIESALGVNECTVSRVKVWEDAGHAATYIKR